jgi:tetratricopeptide (TPR) repeat protein
VLRFLKRLFRRKDTVEYLRETWQRMPSPAVAERLYRALVEGGPAGTAAAFIRDALRMFPQAERLKELYHQTLRVRSSEEIRSLRAALAKSPRPEIYARLGELYRYLGHFEEALEIAREGTRRYPDWSGNYLAIGLVHYSRFLKTASAHDGHQAESYLGKAYALDPRSFKTLYYLAGLYVHVGAKDKAAQCIERLSTLVPGDNKVAELAERLAAMPDSPPRASLDYFRRHEARVAGGGQGEAAQKGLAGGLAASGALSAAIANLAAVQGVKGAYLVDQHGKLLAAAGQDQDTGRVEAAIHGVFEGVRVNARRMSIGTFSRAAVVSRDCQLFLYELDGCGLAVIGGRTTRQDLLQRKVNEFIEERLCEVQGA